jgi:hypothetical protein
MTEAIPLLNPLQVGLLGFAVSSKNGQFPDRISGLSPAHPSAPCCAEATLGWQIVSAIKSEKKMVRKVFFIPRCFVG